MANNFNFWPHFHCMLLILSTVTSVMADPNCQKEMQSVKEACKKYQNSVLLSLKTIFHEEQNCTPCPKCDKEVEKKGSIMERRTEGLIAENERKILFATWGGGLKQFSLVTSEVKTVVNMSQDLRGVAYDGKREKIYWGSDSQIYRSNRDGAGLETVLNTSQYGTLSGMAFDFVRDKIYVASYDGYILACNGSRAFTCVTVLTRQGQLQGIALNPTNGVMYWTRYEPGSIMTSGMDGSNVATLVTGLKDPVGIAVDFPSRRLYWTDFDADIIQSSDFQGRGVQTIVQLPANSRPYGIVVLGQRIYWGTAESQKLQSASKSGKDILSHCNIGNGVTHLAVMSGVDLSMNQTNHY